MDRRGFLIAGAAALATPALAADEDQGFAVWVAGAEAAARTQGVSPAVIASARNGLARDASLAAKRSSPEANDRVSLYVGNLMKGSGLAIAKRKAYATPLDGVAAAHGVPASIQTAFWGRESGYGSGIGTKDVFSTCATLGAAGNKAAEWRAEYIAALRIVQTGVRSRAQFIGSSGGAIGQTQLLPSNFFLYGEDFDRDGRIDIWTSPADALASAARHVQDSRVPGPTPATGTPWTRGGSWLEPVILPARPDFSGVEVDASELSVRAWTDWGLRRASGGNWSAVDQRQTAILALPAGVGGPAFLMFPNFATIERYNRSRSYALAVALLARKIDGAADVAWPAEIALGPAQREGAQQALTTAGVYSGAIDGNFGGKSRAALRAWQRSKGVTPDGYLSLEMVRLLGVGGD